MIDSGILVKDFPYRILDDTIFRIKHIHDTNMPWFYYFFTAKNRAWGRWGEGDPYPVECFLDDCWEGMPDLIKDVNTREQMLQRQSLEYNYGYMEHSGIYYVFEREMRLYIADVNDEIFSKKRIRKLKGKRKGPLFQI